MANRLIVICLAVIVYASAFADETSGISEQQKIQSHLVVNLFLDAVERGEVLVFGNSIRRENLRPVQVAYVYDIEKDSTNISIYAVLHEPVTIPHYEKFIVDGISAVITESGEIIEVKAHVVPE